METLLERLRNAGGTLCSEAADKIERLTSQLEDAGTEIQILELVADGYDRDAAEKLINGTD